MRMAHLGGALALSLGLLSGPALAAGSVTGDYVEARSCNIFIGACHYSGEAVTTGREALMAWHVRGGSRGEVSLAGLSAAAVIAADRNLGEAGAKRTAVLYVDARATPEQRDALVALLKEKYGTAFGRVAEVRAAPIAFTQSSADVKVRVGEDAALTVEKTIDRSCCQQPMQLWYQPLGPVDNRAVGFASVHEFKGSGLPTTWSRNGQNSSFYGQFSM